MRRIETVLIAVCVLTIVGLVYAQHLGRLFVQPKNDATQVFLVNDEDTNPIFSVDTENDSITISGGLSASGDVVFAGDFEVSGLFWEDLRFPAAALSPQNKNDNIPEYDSTNVGWLFADDATETITMIGQLPHRYKVGSDIEAHVHFETTADDSVVWQLEYIWTSMGDTTLAWTTVSDSTVSYTWTAGTIHQVVDIADITGTGKGMSSIIKMKLSRLGGNSGDNHSGDILLTEFDLHYQLDGFGSSTEYAK